MFVTINSKERNATMKNENITNLEAVIRSAQTDIELTLDAIETANPLTGGYIDNMLKLYDGLSTSYSVGLEKILDAFSKATLQEKASCFNSVSNFALDKINNACGPDAVVTNIKGCCEEYAEIIKGFEKLARKYPDICGETFVNLFNTKMYAVLLNADMKIGDPLISKILGNEETVTDDSYAHNIWQKQNKYLSEHPEFLKDKEQINYNER